MVTDLRLDPEPWMASGVCAQVDPDLWFPEKGDPNYEAKALCRSCTVSARCLEYALDNGERYGVWGGASEKERRLMRRTHVAEQVSFPEKVIHLYRSGRTARRIAQALGVHERSVQRVLADHEGRDRRRATA